LEALTLAAPRELQLVRESIFILLSVSPTDVFAVMADDCKGSQEETGASRRNILEFLETAGKGPGPLRGILESGDYLDAEKVFREGFTEVLTTTAIAETRLVLGLLSPLSTVSGKNATIASTSAFIRIMTTSLHGGAAIALAREKQDETAKGLIEKLKTWISGASTNWRITKEESEKDVSAAVLVPAFCETMLEALLVSLSEWELD